MLTSKWGVCGFGFVVDPAGTLLQANFIQYVLYGSGQWSSARLKSASDHRDTVTQPWVEQRLNL